MGKDSMIRHKAIITQMDAANLSGRRFGFEGPVRIGDESVDLIVTSPPYWSLRSYQDNGEHFETQLGSEETPKEYIANLVACTREWLRVLKPSGSLFVNLGDKYAGSGGHNNSNISKRSGDEYVSQSGPRATRRNGPDRYRQNTGGVRPKSLLGLPWRYALECIDTLGLILRAEIIWSKPNGLPESVRDRVARKHEQWFHFTKAGEYYADLNPIREPYSEKTNIPGYTVQYANPEVAGRHGSGASTLGLKPKTDRKVPGSVWKVTTEQLRVPKDLGIEHFAAFPSEWPKRIIQAWSPPSGVVLDPFGGSGTVALAAQELGRVGITNDLSGDYCRLAQWRTTDPKQIERMRKRIAEGVK